MRQLRMAAAVALAIGVGSMVHADEPTKAGLDMFKTKIEPVLQKSCYKCHSAQAKKVKGKLRLDSFDAMAKGGSSGDPAIVPGDPSKSALMKAILYNNKGDDEDLNMPPEKDGRGGKLPDDVIKDFHDWIKMGAPHPASFDKAPAGGGAGAGGRSSGSADGTSARPHHGHEREDEDDDD